MLACDTLDIVGFATGKFVVQQTWFFEGSAELYLLTLGVAKDHQRKGAVYRNQCVASDALL
jgi:hypothetical protein